MLPEDALKRTEINSFPTWSNLDEKWISWMKIYVAHEVKFQLLTSDIDNLPYQFSVHVHDFEYCCYADCEKLRPLLWVQCTSK